MTPSQIRQRKLAQREREAATFAEIAEELYTQSEASPDQKLSWAKQDYLMMNEQAKTTGEKTMTPDEFLLFLRKHNAVHVYEGFETA